MKKYIILLVLWISSMLLLYLFFVRNTSNIAYFEAEKVFAEFELKKQLQSKLQTEQMSHQKILDSFKISLNNLKNNIETKNSNNVTEISSYNDQLQRYMELNENIERYNTAEINKYDEQILTQLQQYINDYAKEYNYTYILSKKAEDIGFFNEEKNITSSLLGYINERYKGRVNAK